MDDCLGSSDANLVPATAHPLHVYIYILIRTAEAYDRGLTHDRTRQAATHNTRYTQSLIIRTISHFSIESMYTND